MFVYKHTCPNGKVYIGITKQLPEKRWSNGHAYNSNPLFAADISKYGWLNIKHEIVAKDLSIEAACELEVQLIQAFDSTNPEKGYNRGNGGGYGTNFAQYREARNRVRQLEKNVSELKKLLDKFRIIYNYFFDDKGELLTQTESEVRAYQAKRPFERLIQEIIDYEKKEV